MAGGQREWMKYEDKPQVESCMMAWAMLSQGT
jgi:hypothetical protein